MDYKSEVWVIAVGTGAELALSRVVEVKFSWQPRGFCINRCHR